MLLLRSTLGFLVSTVIIVIISIHFFHLLKYLKERKNFNISLLIKAKNKNELTILILLPMAVGGRLDLNLALTAPELPCGLVTFPQIALIFVLFFERPGARVLFLAYNKLFLKK